MRFHKNGEVGKRSHGDDGDDFCNKKWGVSQGKKNRYLSGAAARTGNLS